MITIIFGKTGSGKTALLTHSLTMAMFDRERFRTMRRMIEDKNDSGFNLTVPKHCGFSNYYVEGKQFGYSPRITYKINPFCLGFADPDTLIKKHFIPPFAVIGITEGQKYFNARMSSKYPDWQSRFLEAHRHNGYDIYIDIQRFDLVDLNIRELAYFIEIQSVERKVDRNGETSVEWHIRRFENKTAVEKYMEGGQKDDSKWYIEEIIKANYDVFDCYNSTMCEPLFYKDNLDRDFDLEPNMPQPQSKQEYGEYLERQSDERPPDFYGKNDKQATPTDGPRTNVVAPDW